MDAQQEKQKIPGYTYGTAEVSKSPITMEEWEELKKSALFSEEDVFYLRLSEAVLTDQVDDLLKTWRGIIFDHPHLRAYDEDPKSHEVDTDTPKPSENDSVNGCSTQREQNMIRLGSIINTRSGCAIIAAKRTRPITQTP